jgi:aminopeptidase
MRDPRVAKLAETIVKYSTRVKPGDWVHIDSDLKGIPLVEELSRAVLAAGGHPTINLDVESLQRIHMDGAADAQLEWVSPLASKMIAEADVAIFIQAPDNTHNMAGVPVEKLQKRNLAFRKWQEVYMKRSADGSLRWNLTQFPCEALAQDADMSLEAFENFVYRATFADQPDPVALWQQVYDEQQKLVDWMAGRKEIRIKGKHADLVMRIDDRKFINSSATHNMPSGEIFTSPVEDSVNGWVEFTYPAIRQGQEVEGIRLEFKDGLILSATAQKNEAFLKSMVDTDEASHRLGELGIGTNFAIQQFTKSILYDEKIGGSFHLAIGSGFEEAGGRNHSAIHWDMICDAREETEMSADGEVFYRNGKILVE